MIPLITSPRALRELSTGIAADAIATAPGLFARTYEHFDVLLSTSDTADTPLVLIWREQFARDKFVPPQLFASRREALGRMASFAERAEFAQLTLPRGWHQYKHENLVSFFAVPGMDANRVRWITERVNRGPGLTVFWKVDTPKSQVRLEEFRPEVPDLPGDVFEVWDGALQDLQSQLESVRTAVDAEVYLPHLAPTAQKDQTLAGWLSVTSPDQQSFIAAPTDRSIRLRGPAGSGKTLALTLKAVRETLAARTSGSPLRVLIATHSWSLASQISHNIDMLGVGDLPEIEVFPLLAVAENFAPQAAEGIDDYAVVGDDSFSGKRAQLDEILDVLSDFLATDWVTYKKTTSPELRARFESDDAGDHLALAWDLLTEFGSVIGAAGIFPGAGSESRYIQTPRSSWMLPLVAPGDHRVIFRLYVHYMKNLDERKLITTDQVIADFLNYLASHAWNRARRSHGYDLVFVDEFHLFSPLERQAIHYLTANVLEYPRIFMAMDPRQSPSEVFIGVAADSTQSGGNFPPEDDLGDVTNLELSSVHRFTPQILSLVKHIHFAFPTFALGDDWEVDFANVTSSRADGKKPLVLNSGTAFAEENDIVRAVHDVYQRGRVAIAVVDGRFWPRYSQLAATLSQSGKFHVATLSARADIDDIGYRSRGIVLGAAEHLAGLQFETVLTVGLPNIHDTAPVHERRRLLSLLYLAVTRAESEVRIFTNDEDGGIPDVLLQAAAQGHAEVARGAEA